MPITATGGLPGAPPKATGVAPAAGQEALAKAEKEAGGLITEVVMAIRTVASFNMEHEFYETYQKQVDRVARFETIEGGMAGIALGLGMSMMMYMMTGMNLYGGYLLSNNVITFQKFMTPMFMMTVPTTLTGAFMNPPDPAYANVQSFLFLVVLFVQLVLGVGMMHYVNKVLTHHKAEIEAIPDDQEVAKLDADASYFDLIVETTVVRKIAIIGPAHSVTCLVNSSFAKRVYDEFFRC